VADKPVRIALCVITHIDADREDFDRMLASAAPHVDGLFVGYTNESGLPDSWVEDAIKQNGQFKVWQVKAINPYLQDPDDPETTIIDFSTARNMNFQMVSDFNQRHEEFAFDWIIWLDSDDELVNGDKLNKLLATRKETTGLVMMRYEYAVNKETGEEIHGQSRERCLRVSANPTWVWFVHEVCQLPPGLRMHKHDGPVKIVHHRDVFGPSNAKARERNKAILKVAIKLDPEEPRYHLYLAHEEFAEGQAAINDDRIGDASVHIREALTRYRQYIEKFSVLPGDDPYFANCRWAECLRLLGMNDDAVNRDLQGVKMRPTFPEAYLGITEAFANSGQFQLCKEWAEMTLKCATREKDYIYSSDIQANNFLPHWYLGVACEQLGEWDEAIAAYKKAGAVTQNLKDIPEQIRIVKEKQADERNQEKQRAARRSTAGDKKSICFITRPLFEPWHPETVKSGSGGAERCVIEIAERFAAAGFRSVVFGTPGVHRGVHAESGVEYWDVHRDWDSSEPFDIVVSSRAPEVFDTNIPCDLKILWMHDVNVGPMESGPWGNRFEKPDVIIGLTEWHCTHMSRLYHVSRDKFQVIPNGFSPEEFTYTAQADKDPLKFVYASSPDRGVDTLLELWPYIRRDFPGATLETYYGWTGIDKLLERHPTHPIGGFKKSVVKLLEKVNEGDITWNDRVSRETLAQAYQKASIWAYPTEFMETYCITALEMQVSGVIPVVSNLAALKETVPNPSLRLDGMPRNDDYRRRYMRKLHEVIEWPMETREDRAIENFHFARKRTWDSAFKTWGSLANIYPNIAEFATA
jgi:glycosyltransferase involved in cell wall biosynthesis